MLLHVLQEVRAKAADGLLGELVASQQAFEAESEAETEAEGEEDAAGGKAAKGRAVARALRRCSPLMVSLLLRGGLAARLRCARLVQRATQCVLEHSPLEQSPRPAAFRQPAAAGPVAPPPQQQDNMLPTRAARRPMA